ncbi:MAG TPA: hypothetical protein VNT79_01785 [Phycisphaerae bacterium]|nr:hypothetical protein [Phycisphaerae bacterium]
MFRSQMRIQSITIFAFGVLAMTLWTGSGCKRGAVSEVNGTTAEELAGFYSPRDIKVLPFTKPRSFDMKDDIPDGIAVSLRPLDAMNDPIKAYGTFMFELYAYRPASGDRKGQWLQTWTQPVLDLDDQKKFWERVTSTYEFQLTWEGQPLQPQQKYLLVASFQAPGSDRLFDEYEFEFRITREDLMNAMSEESEGDVAPAGRD